MPIITVILTLFLFNFALASDYQSYDKKGGYGYSEQKYNDNVYIVTYKDELNVTPQYVNDMVFLRSAELTLEKGFAYFTVKKAVSNNNKINKARFGQGSSPDVGAFKSRARRKSELRIEFHKIKPEGDSFQANMMAASLKEEYQINNP